MGTYADHVGIRGLMQSFGLIFGLDRLPELIDPDNFSDQTLEIASHVYTIAGPKANRMTGLMMQRFFQHRTPRWEFKPDPDSDDLRNPKVLLHFDGNLYRPVRAPTEDRSLWDCGLVIRGPHPSDSRYMFMALAGRAARGTEACCLAVTNPECIQKLSQELMRNSIDLDNHMQAFCAVVSISGEKDGADPDLWSGPADINTFRVEDVKEYKH